jgi:hypothetical protein
VRQLFGSPRAVAAVSSQPNRVDKDLKPTSGSHCTRLIYSSSASSTSRGPTSICAHNVSLRRGGGGPDLSEIKVKPWLSPEAPRLRMADGLVSPRARTAKGEVKATLGLEPTRQTSHPLPYQRVSTSVPVRSSDPGPRSRSRGIWAPAELVLRAVGLPTVSGIATR